MATTTRSTLVAVFKDTSDAEAAANELKRKGINPGDIDLASESGQAGSRESVTPRHEGGFIGWLKRVFGDHDEEDRQTYESAYRSGNVLLAVDTSDENIDTVAEILGNYSPVDIHQTSTDAGATAASAGAGARTSTSTGAAGQARSIPVVQEDVKVGKRSVLRCGVRVYSRVTEQPIEEKVRLREEKVRVDRQPVNRPATDADLRAGQEQVIEVDEYAEEPVVEKQVRVSEEVRVRKEASERTETVRDTARRTEVNVENLSPGKSRASTSADDLDDDFRRDFASRYGKTGETYESYSPAYRYGCQMASDPRFQGQNFSEIESDLRAGYARQFPNNPWEKMKASVQYGWDRVRGRAKSATTSR